MSESERRWTKLPDGTVWQNPLREASVELEHLLRYGDPTRSDLLAAAAQLSCYWSLVRADAKRRQRVVSGLRKDAK